MKKMWLIVISCFFVVNLVKIVKAEEVDLTPNAASGIMIEASTGEIIYEKNAYEKLAPASMTKMMSMLLIMENIENGNLDWDEKVTASAYASSMGGSQIFLEPGESMTVTDLLKGIAIGSGNDATVAMAERVAGTEGNFVKMMNDKVKELGLSCTNFKNTTGLDADDHYSCAYDMVMIAKELVKHEKILEFTGTYEDYLRTDTDNKFWLVNTNKLVRYYEGADGLKTGYTSKAGYCLTATAIKNGMRLITVVMNEPSSAVRSSETSNLLDYGFNMYSLDKVLTTESVLDNVKVELGDVEYVDVVPSEDVNILNNKTGSVKKVDYDYEIGDLKAPVKVGDVVGKLNINVDGKLINTIDLTVDEDVFKANFLKVLARNLKSVIQGDFF